MGRTTWSVYKIVGLTWTADGTIYRPNDNMELPKLATQVRVQLADGSKAYVTPSTLYLNDPLTFIWYYDDGTTKTKIEGYITNQTDLKIVDHNSIEYIGRFVSIQSALAVGMEPDTFDIQAVFERMADIGSSSSSSSSSSTINVNRSNGNIMDEDMSNITDWTDFSSGGTASQVTFDSQSCMKLDSGTTSGDANRYILTPGFVNNSIVSINMYHDLIGPLPFADMFCLQLSNGSILITLNFTSNGLFLYDQVSTYTEVGSGLVVQDQWQEWTFDINWVAETFDVYLNNILKVSSMDVSGYATIGDSIRLIQSAQMISNTITYVDWIKIGSGFEL